MIKYIFLGNKDRCLLTDESFECVAFYPDATKETLHHIERVKQKDILIVVSSNQMEIWGELLSRLTYRFGVDYVDELTVLYRYGNPRKKLIVMYGNCQMHDYYDFLNMSVEFRDAFNSIYFKYLSYPCWKEDYLEALLSICDIFIKTNEAFDERFRNCEKFISYHNKSAKVIHLTTYSFRGYFPQTNAHIQQKGEFDIISEYFNTFHREDKYVNQLISQGVSKEEIIRKVQSGTCFEESDIKRNLLIALKQIQVMDRNSDIEIYEYVKANYQNERLFKDPVHMEDVLVCYIGNKILELLELPHITKKPDKEIHYFTQLPIYPEVVKALGLKWFTSKSELRVRMQEGMIGLTMDAFYERYLQFAQNTMEIKESLIINSNVDKVKEWFFHEN